MLPNGNLLFNTGHGVKEVTRDKKVVFDYESSSEIYACQRLANGNTFVGECNAGRLLELAPDGKIVKEIRLLPEGKDGGHAYMRNARQLANGNYLVAHYGEQVVREYDPQGKMVREIPAPGGPHSVVRLPNGNTLIACGDSPGGQRVIEVDKAGKTVWEVQSRRTARHQPQVHDRPAAPAQRQHRHVQLARPRPIRQGPAPDRSHAGQTRRLDLLRWQGNQNHFKRADSGRAASRRHARGSSALNRNDSAGI